MGASEHILLESDERKVPHPRSARKLHARFELRSRIRRRTLQLELIDYYYLVVRLYRARLVAAEYVLDLRFVDTSVALSRHVASRWLFSALALIALAGAITFRIGGSAAPVAWLAAGGLVFGMGLAATIVCIYRTTETLSIHSVNGRARLFEFTAGLGVKRAAAPFTTKLAAHVRLATAARRPLKSEHLRDEMREHFRLRESGVLSNEEYEASKVRILAEHTPAEPLQTLNARERRAGKLAPSTDGGWY